MRIPKNISKTLFILAAVPMLLYPSYQVCKPLARKWKWFIVGANIYQDTLRRMHFTSVQIGQSTVITRSPAQLPGDLDRIQSMFGGYRRFYEDWAGGLRGKRVLELGPGFNIGIPLKFVAAGADQAMAIDKFVPLQDSEYFRALYSRLREGLSGPEQDRFDEAIQIAPRMRLNPRRLVYIHGRDLPEVVPAVGERSIDLVVSNAVLEEIHDSDALFAAIDHLLRPGGWMIHKIDLSDYGMFTKHGFSPLEFLTIPGPLYRHMAEASGQPNRRLVNYYRQKMAELGYASKIFITWVVGGQRELSPPKERLGKGIDYGERNLRLIENIRPRLAAPFRNLSDEDLLVQGILLVGRKPGSSGPPWKSAAIRF